MGKFLAYAAVVMVVLGVVFGLGLVAGVTMKQPSTPTCQASATHPHPTPSPVRVVRHG